MCEIESNERPERYDALRLENAPAQRGQYQVTHERQANDV